MLAQTDVGVAPQPRASGEAWAAPYEAIGRAAQAGQHLAGSLSRLAAVERMKYLEGVKVEADALNTAMEYNAKTSVNALKNVEQDPDAYLQKANEAIKGAYTETAAMAKYPETRALLTKRLNHIFLTVGTEAAAHSDSLYLSRNHGLLDTKLNQLLELSNGAPDQPEYVPGEEPGTAVAAKGKMDYLREGQQAITNAANMFPPRMVADLRIKWDQRFAYNTAESQLRTDPLTDIGGYRERLTPEQYDRLLTRQDTLRREARVASEHEERRTQQAVDRENQNRVGEIEALVLSGNRDEAMRKLNFYGPNDVNVLKPGDYVRIHGMITNPKDFASDPATKTALIANVYRLDPQWSAAQINALHQAGKLNDTDTISALNHLQSTQHSNLTRETDKQLTALKYKQSEVQRIGDLLLTTKSPLEAIDPKANALKARYNLEMLNRSSAFGGKEDPHAVMLDVLPGLAKQLKDDTSAYVTDLTKQLAASPYKTPGDLKAAFDGSRIGRKEYEKQRDLWLKLDTAQQQTLSLDQQMKELFTPSRPSGQR